MKCPTCNGSGEVQNRQVALLDLPGFAEFWAAYPAHKRRAKPTALRAWRAQRIDAATLPQVLAALERDKASWEWTKANGQFVCYPATWLNGRRWEDLGAHGHRSGLDAGPGDGWKGINVG